MRWCEVSGEMTDTIPANCQFGRSVSGGIVPQIWAGVRCRNTTLVHLGRVRCLAPLFSRLSLLLRGNHAQVSPHARVAIGLSSPVPENGRDHFCAFRRNGFVACSSSRGQRPRRSGVHRRRQPWQPIDESIRRARGLPARRRVRCGFQCIGSGCEKGRRNDGEQRLSNGRLSRIIGTFRRRTPCR